MIYLLDTDTIIFLLRGNPAVAERIREVGDDNIATTAINLAELYFGAFHSTRVDENLDVTDRFRRTARILQFDEKAAVIFGRVKATLMREGKVVDDSDLFIAAVTLSMGAVLVTNNVRHFTRVEGLTVENWIR